MGKKNIFIVVFVILSPMIGRAQEVGEVFKQNCAKCHGVDGKGQTTVGKKLKVPDFTLADWQSKNDTKKIRESIEKGAKDKSGKEIMVPYQEKLKADQIEALVTFVQSLGKQP